MKNRKFTLVALLLVVVMMFTACAGAGNNGAANEGTNNAAGNTATADSGEAKILRTNNNSEPGSLDPGLATGTHESWVLQHAFEGLMRYNEEGELIPAMAESYEASEDGLTYTFKLKDGLKWSNGEPITAKDFEFSWKRVLDPDYGSEYSYQITNYIVGAQEVLDGTGSPDDVGIKALDDKTLEVKLLAPTPYFVGLTAFYTLYPVSEAVVTENPDWAKDPSNTEFVSNGAFKVVSWEHNSKIVLEKNENYFDADKVKLDGIEFDIIEDGNTSYSKYQGNEYDLIVSPPATVTAQGIQEENSELVIGDDIGVYYYEFNSTEKPFTNAKVRQALSMAIDRKTMVENIAQGGQTPAQGVVPNGLLDDTGADFREANGNLITEDAAKAKTLLEEGLAEEGMTVADLNGKVLVYNTDENHKKLAQAVQEMWKQNLGVEIGLENMEFQVLLDRRSSGDFSIARAGWMGDYADPNTMLDLFMTGNPQNDSGYTNPEFDNLMKTAAGTNDQKVRMDSMKEAEKILVGDMPIIPVYFYTQPRLQKPWLTGVYKHTLNYPTMTYADIDMSQK
ncbi:peptide ABC transporter substrate-binding protein [Peptoniphilus sp. KCTC 25270]|uniref:peptide ABC transporter substrate-binding protein n=1 Tax=Peptoniphilus sp. KCTC 25270 TaxID=2897414 RepID=UPI001E3699B3|nr:peptide ABC transporter substrate-binding protein [Peptoniphilus sp. KCTC 25270]MCD1147211.1 peptide ABC transporter substrate-binding protein [Peptoniphilus sp. KCTC 25270]